MRDMRVKADSADTGEKAPVRTCVACRRAYDKAQLCRIVRTPAGTVELDASGRAPGRGAYVCYDGGCFAQARKRRLLAPRLKCKVSEADYERLESRFAEACAAYARGAARQVGTV